MATSWRESVLRLFWLGGSTYDAWLNLVTAKIASRLFTYPQSTAQMGLPSAIVFQLLLAGMGLWSHSIINILYLKYKESQIPQSNQKRWHTTQLYEVIGLLGPKWKIASLLFTCAVVFWASTGQLVACSNIAYSINPHLDKRAWTFIFGAVFSISMFVPSAHNFRIWSFIGVIAIIYTSVYMTVATFVHDKVAHLEHTSPRSYREYFGGAAGSLLIGNVIIPVEIMDAMWKPNEYRRAYLFGTICVVFIAMVPSISMERKFGDKLLTTPNALLLLPKSRFRDIASILMILHVFIDFGMFSIAVYAMWEKLMQVHNSPSYAKRSIYRIPVFLAIWLIALAFPFFGPLAKLTDAILVTWSFYIIPCAAYIVVFWSPSQRRHSTSFSRLGWATDFVISLIVILWVLVIECGLGFWGNMDLFLKLKDPRPFARCYGCS